MKQKGKRIQILISILLVLSLLIPCALDSIDESRVSAAEQTAKADYITAVALNAGSDETQLNFTWYANTSVKGVVQIAEAWSDRADDGFPVKYQEAAADQVVEVTHQDYAVAHDDIYDGWYSNKATVTGLKPGVEYLYRVGNNGIFTEPQSYKVYGDEESFGFVYSGDPQLDNDKNLENTIVRQWKNSMRMIMEKYPDTGLLVLGGDLANSGSEREYQYSQGLMAPEELKHLALATSVGNHDEFGDGNAYRLHFNQPNQTEIGAYRDVPGDYWYTYHNVLFIHLTTSNVQDINTSLGYVDSHVNFVRETLEKNRDCDWHILVFHESLFSQATHCNTINTRSMRNRLAPKLAELDEEYGIDLALSAHDHSYSRTYTMQGLVPLETEEVEHEITNPDGIIYITANTGSGIKYYEPKEIDYNYLAVRNQEFTPNISYVKIDTSPTETSLAMTVYRTADGEDYTGSDKPMSIVDQFTITKNISVNKTVTGKTVKKAGIEVKLPAVYGKELVTAKISQVNSGSSYDKLMETISKDEDFEVYEPAAQIYRIAMQWKEKEVQSEGEMQVKVPLPAVKDGYEYALNADGEPQADVYVLDHSGNVNRIYGKNITITSDKKGKYYASFAAKDLSEFAIVGKAFSENRSSSAETVLQKAAAKPAQASADTKVSSAKKTSSGQGKVSGTSVKGLVVKAQKGTKVKISWKKTAGAKKYVIYRSNKKNGVYKKFKTVAKTSYVDKNGRKNGKVCYYKVKVK